MKNDQLEDHPFSLLFPILPPSDFKELVQSIKEYGLQYPIVMFEGKILDGRHRYQACISAHVAPKFAPYTGKNALGFVLGSNLHRRHLDTGQRAVIAAKLVTMKCGGDRKSVDADQKRNSAFDQSAAAETLGVSTDSVKIASKIIAQSPTLAKQLSQGKISLHAAEKKLDEKTKKDEVRRDSIGRVIPVEIQVDWDRAVEVSANLKVHTSEIKRVLERGFKEQDVIFGEMLNHTIIDASALRYSLMQMEPYSVCPFCQGRVRETCQVCKRRGWISKYLYNSTVVPREMRAMVEKEAQL